MREIVLASDLDNTLIGVPGIIFLMDELDRRGCRMSWVYLTGRHHFSAMQAVLENFLAMPAAMGCDVGSTIYWEGSVRPDPGWSRRLARFWRGGDVLQVARRIEGLHSLHSPNPFRVTGKFDASVTNAGRIEDALGAAGLAAKVVLSNGDCLDLIPAKAGKGPALKYICATAGLGERMVVVAGDSENDADLFDGTWPGIVVGNAVPALKSARLPSNIYRAGAPGPKGVLEGLLKMVG
ncbi:MAG: HAD hydrolase family protein [Peptococcaceae bacterium]|jgi:hydroxymethylpyrimidine pyrophosphatase-like HAD family hydrolase|nr:HAD hydrolase family protein [Peptococcaceae bacterium]